MAKDKPLDFTPFDAEANLLAVSDVLRSVRHMSWSYAGDISRVVTKISKTFDAGRCILFAAKHGGEFDVYEHCEDDSSQLFAFFNSKDGQNWLNNLIDRGDDFISSDSFIELESDSKLELPEELMEPATHLIPLKNPYTSRYGIKPGFMLIQEPRSLNKWNKKQLNSIVIVAEYLAMVIECERLTTQMQIDSSLESKLPGVLPRRRFSEIVNWELSKIEAGEGKATEANEQIKPVFVLIGFPDRTKLCYPQILNEADVILKRCAKSVLDIKSKSDVLGYWRGDILVAFSPGGGDKFTETLVNEVRRVFLKWAESAGIGTTLENIPAFGVAHYPVDGSSIEELYEASLREAMMD